MPNIDGDFLGRLSASFDGYSYMQNIAKKFNLSVGNTAMDEGAQAVLENKGPKTPGFGL